MTRPFEPPTNFETIGSRLPEIVEPNSIGRGHGVTESGRSLIVSDDTARAWLLGQATPRSVDEAVRRSLISTCGVTALPRTESRFPPSGGFYTLTVGCELILATDADLYAAREKVKAAMTPAKMEDIEGWLVMLQAACAHRTESEAGATAAYGVYAAHLGQYPADVARAACMKAMRGTGDVQWFPTLSELLGECDRLVSERRTVLAALESPTRQVELNRDRTAEAKAAIRAMADDYLAKHETKKAAETKLAPPLPAIHGKPDETGLTPEMRALNEARKARWATEDQATAERKARSA